MAIANSTPRGPVYVSLPREVLCEPAPAEGLDAAAADGAGGGAARGRSEIAEAARILAGAEHPVIFAQHGAGSAEAFAALAALAGDWGIPVCQYWALALAVPTDHPMAAAADPAPLLARADAILVLDALAPWSPQRARAARRRRG